MLSFTKIAFTRTGCSDLRNTAVIDCDLDRNVLDGSNPLAGNIKSGIRIQDQKTCTVGPIGLLDFNDDLDQRPEIRLDIGFEIRLGFIVIAIGNLKRRQRKSVKNLSLLLLQEGLLSIC